jgi:hypothetical protein
MTPQEQELVEELFYRLAKLESSPRDPAAERVIADGLRRAPQATYALVQTALVQDEALKRANARIEELQAQLGGDEQTQQPGSFLDSIRDAVLGRRDPRSSVPTVRSQAQSSATTAPPYQRQGENAMGGSAFGSGGSFLGTAASTAAGVISGGLLLNSIRSMFGQHAGLGGEERSAFGSSSGSGYRDMAEKQRDQDQDQDQDDQDQDDQDQDQDQDQDDQDQDDQDQE